LGDQLSTDLRSLRDGDREQDIVLMAEVLAEAEYVPHHPKKIAFIFSAMRKFAKALEEEGWQVRYTQLDDSLSAGSLVGELLRCSQDPGLTQVLVTEPGEWRVIEALKAAPLTVHMVEDDRFLASHAEFESWAQGRKQLRMEYFYRDMRRKTGLLMDGDKPEGGKWNYDHDNRKPAPDEITYAGPMQFTPDETVCAVLDLVEARFGSNFGTLRPFYFATDRNEARAALSQFVRLALPRFGDFQDAMLDDNRFLYHAVLSPYLNVGLLSVLEVCRAAEDAYRDGHAPLNAVEGFIRQIIGWREYVRGIYFLEGSDYAQRNALGHDRDLPAFYWGGETRMRCVSKAIEQTAQEAYAHHIQRLMVTGNFALLAGLNPHHVHEWYLSVYIDAFEWVEAPNTVGMSLFADGGIIASKPYVSSGAYINRMSNHCKQCAYKVSAKTGEQACPFNLLYWHFLHRHRTRFANNPRMANMYRTWDRMDDSRKHTVLSEAETLLRRLDQGAAI